MVAQGNALGFGIDRCALQGRRNPHRPCRAEDVSRTRSRGVAPGWHAPRPWRVNAAEFSIGETCCGPIYEIGSRFEYLKCSACASRYGIQILILRYFESITKSYLPLRQNKCSSLVGEVLALQEK